MATILGRSTMSEQPDDYGWDIDKGTDSIKRWKGPTSSVEAITNTIKAAGYSSYRVRNLPGGLSEIEARIASGGGGGGGVPTVADVVDTWELGANSVLKDICESDCAAIRALTETELQEIRHYQKNRPAPIDTPAWSDWVDQGPIVNLIDAGVESWEVEQPILRHTFIIPRGVIYPFTWANIWKIHTTAQLISLEKVPADYVLDLAAIGALFGNPTRSDNVELVYGWRKKFPSQSITAQGKREVHIEYHFGLWSTLLYTTVA